ncbi:MAG: hypothetical protein U9R79_05885 [Armatimonadota bacterium]|nr:hypothetical protein [Armatimonadota bacterium]
MQRRATRVFYRAVGRIEGRLALAIRDEEAASGDEQAAECAGRRRALCEALHDLGVSQDYIDELVQHCRAGKLLVEFNRAPDVGLDELEAPEVEMSAVCSRALCTSEEWDAATARARTSRANQDPPRWADPTSLDIQEEVRYVWAIVPAPSPIAAREAGCDVELNERGELLGVAWSFGHFAVGEDGALAVGPDQRHEMRRLRSLAQALHVPVEADVEADLDRLGARKGQIKARLVEVDG